VLEDVSAEHADRPGQRAVAEHVQVHVEHARRRGQAEAEVRVRSAHVELEQRPARQLAPAEVAERVAQEAGLEDRDARPEPETRAELDHVPDRRRRVHVCEARQVHAAGIDDPDAQAAARHQEVEVREALLRGLREADGRIEQGVGARGEHGREVRRVELRRSRGRMTDPVDVRVHDRGAGLEAGQRVADELRRTARHVGIRGLRGRPVQRGFEHHGGHAAILRARAKLRR
jgi:hypothetical protein